MAQDSVTSQLSQTPWLGIELRHLASFRALDRTRSFRAAANELGYVQSAISQQISQIEAVVGVRLVDRRRGKQSVSLTPAGEVFAVRAAAVVAQLDAAQADLTAGEATPSGLRIALAPSLAEQLRPRIDAALAARLPQKRHNLVVPAYEEELDGLIETGAADLAVGELVERERFAFQPLVEDPYVFLPAAGAVPSETGVAVLNEVRQAPLLAPLATQGLSHAERHLRAYGISARHTGRALGVATLLGLVRSGLGAAILPGLSLGSAEPGLAALSLAGVLPPRPIVIFWNSRRRRIDSFAPACEAIRAATAAAWRDQRGGEVLVAVAS